MERQSGLGVPREHRATNFNQTKIARVTSTAKYDKYGMIEVVFLDYGRPAPVWVIGDIDRKPSVGDQVIIGYLEGRKDSPYLVGFAKGFSKTHQHIQIREDYVKLQVGTTILEVSSSGVKVNGKTVQTV